LPPNFEKLPLEEVSPAPSRLFLRLPRRLDFRGSSPLLLLELEGLERIANRTLDAVVREILQQATEIR
jgi:hypothetical protein